MAYKNALSAGKMAARIYNREDNIYEQSIIKEILGMYANEIYKAMLDGERVQISKLGTITPEVKTREAFNLPSCNREGGNPLFTKIRMSRNHAIKENMDRQLLQNMDNGIYGLAKTPFSRKQMDIMKKYGYSLSCFNDDTSLKYPAISHSLRNKKVQSLDNSVKTLHLLVMRLLFS